jgi:hypothetical protein
MGNIQGGQLIQFMSYIMISQYKGYSTQNKAASASDH